MTAIFRSGAEFRLRPPGPYLNWQDGWIDTNT